MTEITVLNGNHGKQPVESHLENSRRQLDGDGVYGKEVKSEGLLTPRVGSRPSH